MKYLVFGIGSDYNVCKDYINGEVVGYIDNNRVGEKMDNGNKILSLDAALELEYDKILIASSKYKKEMYNQLTEKVNDTSNRVVFLEDLVNDKKFIELYSDCIKKQQPRVKKNNSKIYVIAPAKIATGGPELLHQLVYELKKSGVDSFIAYTNCADIQTATNDAYMNYISDNKCTIDEIPDEKDVTVVVPETLVESVERFRNAQIYMWWLSVDNFLICEGINALSIVYDKISMHMYQSEYARQFLTKIGISEENMVNVSDYINEEYLREGRKDVIEKKDIILYNPEKGKIFTEKIKNNMQDYIFMPIVNMTREEVVDALKQAKVYIDFGFHPGKDRIPREAAIMGCCVVTGRRGSAENMIDIPIMDKYKIDENRSIDEIVEVIEDCVHSYEDNIYNYDEYREMICKERDLFSKQVKSAFGLQA